MWSRMGILSHVGTDEMLAYIHSFNVLLGEVRTQLSGMRSVP
jgi:hypothetical protein